MPRITGSNKEEIARLILKGYPDLYIRVTRQTTQRQVDEIKVAIKNGMYNHLK